MEKRRRIVTKIGDVFCAPISADKKRYFQYIAIDGTQLGSSVIRAFAKTYSMDDTPKLEDVVQDEVEFYAHTILSYGISYDAWAKVGKVKLTTENFDVLFATWSDDMIVKYNRDKNASPTRRWRTWHINDPDFTYMDNDTFQLVDGVLKVNDLRFEKIGYICNGMVIDYESIVFRLKTGRYAPGILWPRWTENTPWKSDAECIE